MGFFIYSRLPRRWTLHTNVPEHFEVSGPEHLFTGLINFLRPPSVISIATPSLHAAPNSRPAGLPKSDASCKVERIRQYKVGTKLKELPSSEDTDGLHHLHRIA